MFGRFTFAYVILAICVLACETKAVQWEELKAVERTPDGYKTTGVDPWMVSKSLDKRVSDELPYMLIEVRTSRKTTMQVFWMDGKEGPAGQRSVKFEVHSPNGYTTYAVDLNVNGAFKGATKLRLDPALRGGLQFDIKKIEFVRMSEVPEHLISHLVDFRCYTSKRHYLPGELISYRAVLNVESYPDRQSSKILEVTLVDESGKTVATAVQQYGIRPGLRIKEVQGVIDTAEALPAGKYLLKAVSTDQRSSLKLTSEHQLGVLGPDDPCLYETPFKFVKDFSFVRGSQGRWHVFSITGDFFENHAWEADGQERTFSHASSEDLRHWTIHPPVISIHDKPHPDNNGRYQDRNVWAPHVIEHQGEYWMLYTSVNQYVSQSISLARSKDLFNWKEYEHNPVFTPEGISWAKWSRTGWGNCRDPMVLQDGGKFYLYVTASDHHPTENGVVIVSESEDLIHWKNPAIAVRGRGACESPVVWKVGDTYCMTTSSKGSGTFVSDHPMKNWKRTKFLRPPTREIEKYVQGRPSYAEEVVHLQDGSTIMAGLTMQHWGNTIYFFRMITSGGVPVGYARP